MKKLIIIIFTILAIFAFNSVKAETLNIQPSGYYFTRFDPSDGHKTSDEFKLYDIDGVVSYCIEPDVHEGTSDYIPSDWSGTGLNSNLYNKINLIAYYGYSYPGHVTLKYRMATQGLIWEEILGETSWTRFNTNYWERGTNIDVTEEKNSIINLVNNHNKRPSFANTVKEAYVNEEIVLEDTNNALSMFNISIEGADSYEIFDNKIIIKSINSGQIIVNMNKKNVYSNQYKIFISNAHQNIYTVGNIDNISYRTTINVLQYAKVKVIKKSTNDSNEYLLKDAVYELYDTNNNMIEELKTDEGGIAISSTKLKKGKYYIKEKEAPLGYEIDQEMHEFNVNGIDELAQIDVYDKPIEREVTLIKKKHNQDGYIPEEGITFSIFKNDKIFFSITTDESGYAKLNLSYGSYIVKQINTSTGYLKVDDFQIVIDENSPKDLLYELIDEPIQGSLEIHKVNSKTNEPLSGVNLSIYDEKDNLISSGITNENGLLLINDLFYGKYYIVEDEPLEGFRALNDKIWFTIDTHNSLAKVEIKNDPITAHLHIKKMDNNKNTISNVSFAIFNNNDELISIEVTDESGIIDLELPYGNYYFIEYSTPNGYQANNEKNFFNIDGTANQYEFTIINVPKTYKSKSILVSTIPIKLIIILWAVLCKKRLALFV